MQNNATKRSKSIRPNGEFSAYMRTNRLFSASIRNDLPTEILTNSSALLLPLVDTLIVGNLIGDDALAAVNLTTPIFLLCSIITRTLYSGLSKTISVYLGKNDKEGLNRCYIANRMILIFGFILTFLVQLPVAYVVIKTYSFKSNNYGMVWAYFLSSMIGAPFDFAKSICVHNLRAFGKLKNLAKLTIIIHLINLFGDIILIRFCNLGIYGAGFATSISQIIFGVTSFVLVSKKTDINKFEKKPWIREMKNILTTGFPRGLRVGLNALQSWVLSCVVLYALDMSGMAAKAACMVVRHILLDFLALFRLTGLAMAASDNLVVGAKLPQFHQVVEFVGEGLGGFGHELIGDSDGLVGVVEGGLYSQSARELIHVGNSFL